MKPERENTKRETQPLNTMNENTKAAAAFVAAQKGFGSALKTATNPHFRSRYADLSACVEAVIDSLHSNGFALLQVTHPSDSGVAVETILMHEAGGQISGGILHVPATKNDAQGYGSALTYARRYSLMATCGIAPEDDDGNAASKKKARSKQEVEAVIKSATSIMDLQAKWGSLSADEKLLATDAKDAKKAEFSTGDGMDEARKLIAESMKGKAPQKMAETEEEIEALWK